MQRTKWKPYLERRKRRDLRRPPSRGTLLRMRNWASYVQAAREQAGLSRSELAKKIGAAYATVWRWETGRQRPERAEIVVRFASVTGVDLDEALAAAGLRPAKTAPARPATQQLPLDPDLAWLAQRLQDPSTPATERELIRTMVRHLAQQAGAGDQRREAG